VALLGLASIAAPAGAATEIGQLAPASPPPEACGGGNTFVQHGVRAVAGPPGYRVPAGGGVITQWTFRQGLSNSSTVKLKVLRNEGGTTYRTIGDVPLEAVAPSSVNTFRVGPPGIAVQEGDVIALRVVGSAASCRFPFQNSTTGDLIQFVSTDAAVGTSTNYSVTSAPDRLSLTAMVEPDRDGDGSGDDSQDFDDDGDGVADTADNCPVTASSDTADPDADGQGNPCDPDDDGDGLTDATEASLGTNPGAPDTDGDGRQDGLDRCPLDFAATAFGCPAPDELAPGVALAGFPSRLTRRALLAGRLRGTVTPSEPAALEIRLLGTLTGTRITRAGDVVLAERSLPLAAGPRSVTLRVTPRARRRLSRRLRLRLEVRATDAAGNRTLVTRRVAVR
jgi:hypothetical protein